MRRVLFVTNTYHAPLYTELQQKYVVKADGLATTLRVAANMLQSADQPPDAVVFGADLLPPTTTLEFIRKAANLPQLRGIKWVVLLDQNVAFMGSELSGLATTLVFQETTPADLAAALDAPPAQTGRTIALTIINTKGGTGKTSLIVNLADALARRGRRTVILDADVADGNIGLALGLPPSTPTIDQLAGEISAGKDAYQVIGRYLYERSPNLFVLPAPDRRDYGQDYLNEATAAAIFNAMNVHRFDAALIDLPGNVRATPFMAVLAACPDAYFYLIYTPGQTFGVKGFDGAAQIIGGLNARTRARMVVLENRDGEPWSEAELQRNWNLPIAGKLPHDPLVERSQAAGQTVAEYLGAQKSLAGQVGRGLSRLTGNRDYLAAVEGLTDWLLKHDLKGND